MTTTSLRGRMDAALPEIIADIEALVTCESPSADRTAVSASAQLVSRIGTDRLGVEPERIELDGCAHLRWRLGSGPARTAAHAP